MPTPQQVGRAGELFVAAELNRRGAIATLFLTNTPRVDIVASDREQQRTVHIQVKTKGAKSRVWQWDIEKARQESQRASETDFIVLVDLHNIDETPDYYIGPLKELSQMVVQAHETWLESRGGIRPRTESSTHTSISVLQVERWRSRWEVLGVCDRDIR